jgi:hypothetical protein
MPSIAVALALLAVSALGEPTHPAEGPQLPAEIQEHYRDYNIVTAFSTVSERSLLAGGHLDSSNFRLARIARLMRRLSDRVDQIDPGIIAPSGRRRPEATDRAELLRVRSFDLDESQGEAWLYLEALALEPPANITLVSRFGDLASADTEPSIDELVAATARPLVRTFEIHHWVRVGDAWRREAATRHFIGRFSGLRKNGP